MVTGSLLGLTVGNKLEVTHSFSFPEAIKKNTGDVVGEEVTAAGAAATSAADHMDGHEYQLEMMKMLREVNVDNNCVGWYQSMYLGSFSTQSLVENQLSYQTDLSPNAVVILYDPIQTTHGNLALKCLRLTDEAVKLMGESKNNYVDSRNIFEEIPVVLTNPGLVQALLFDVRAGTYNSSVGGGAVAGEDNDQEDFLFGSPAVDMTFDNLDMSTNIYLEKHLEFLCQWVDDLAAEQAKFTYFARSLTKTDAKHGGRKKSSVRQDKEGNDVEGTGWASAEAPKRFESLLIDNQIRSYCDQMDRFTGAGFGKLFLAKSLHKDDKSKF
jgi:translation initiation factor 3 subunit H